MNHRVMLATAILAVIGAAITAYLTVQHGRGDSPACIVGHGCAVIATSKYAHIGVIPTASFGLLAYLTLLMLALVRLARPPEEVDRLVRLALLGIAFSGTAFSAWLMYTALIVLDASCIWCIGSATTVTLIFLLLAVDYRVARRDAPL